MISSFRFRIAKITAHTFNCYMISSQWKEARQLQKMINKIANKKKPAINPTNLLKKGLLPSAYDNEGESKRITTLNKVYMEQITMMLNCGKYGSQFNDLGIEITKVKVASGLNFLNIYWIIRKDDIPESVIIETLNGALAELQQVMGGIRYISKVPFLKFVKDVRYEREMQLKKIFDSADFGKDFKPVHGKEVFTQDFVLQPGEMPKMRQNVLGLDHGKIKERIEAVIKNLKAVSIEKPDSELEEDKQNAQQYFSHKLIQFSKKEFIKFYKRNRILALKMRKRKMMETGVCYEYVENYEDEADDEFDESDQVFTFDDIQEEKNHSHG